MDGVSVPAPLWLPAFDIEAAADAVETAVARLRVAQRVEWVSAAADEFLAEVEALLQRMETLAREVDQAWEAWREAQWAAERAGQW
ncbi:hypothetical protein [Demequina sp. NBRC 110055]|uniref:hypothetical protein n=1 Tax=Demequina sp. NBRC 110055 TaxID=1570344 RepID=UPI001186E2CD|nr:hypothetical protein [Demequina sp. NBRC 110055]